MNLRYITAFILIVIVGCTDDQSKNQTSKSINLPELKFQFQELGFDQTGIKFQNKIFENDDLNYFSYEYLYNGGGVSVADFNNDGLDDIFYTCNMGFNRLYKNNGGLRFQDVSKTSNIRTSRDWCTGTTIVDINQDGLLDLYVSRSGWFDDPNLRSNLLYINKGNFIFEEQAELYGINDQGYSTQSSFFDADGDGDLDLYVMNHPVTFSESLKDFISKTKNPPQYQSDNFYENVNGKFTNASSKWGINNYGHGLGLVTADFNNDGKIDVYVSNDYQQHDYLYINKGGKFVESSKDQLRHMAKFSMGVDASDFNNDGLMDIMAVEMMPADNYRKKTNMANMNPKLYATFVDNGLQDQEMHNVLQVNTGDDLFTDEAYLRGVAESDWSWAPLFADFDGDLAKDLFISNGYRRDVLNKDVAKTIEKSITKENFKFTDVKDFYKMHLSQNAFYKNDGHGFSKQEGATFNTAFNTNGAAYSDLDNDGDLDIVCNNMESGSVIYENRSQPKASLKIALSTEADPFGFGARVDITIGNQKYTYANTPTRGFESSVPPYIAIPGINSTDVKEIDVVWPGGKREKFTSFASNKIDLSKGGGKSTTKQNRRGVEVQSEIAKYKHQEKDFDDYKLQPLLPYNVSDQGPFSVKGDIDGNKSTEIFITGSAGQSARLFEVKNGSLEPSAYGKELFESQKDFEDSGACLFDLNGDGLKDVYVSRGSYESNSPIDLEDVIYINTGKGFRIEKSPIQSNSVFPLTIDFDNDGDDDVFVGGGIIPGKYPLGSSSYILENEGGKLRKTKLEMDQVAFVTGSAAMDVNNDGTPEIIVIGEWSSPQILQWSNSSWTNISEKIIPSGLNGLWSSIYVSDLDNDGVEEILLGNLGLNTKYRASIEEPFQCYSNDFDENGTSEIVLAAFENGSEFPIRGKQCSSEQLPTLNSTIESYDIFAKSDVEAIYGEKLKNGSRFTCEELASGYLKMSKSGKFEFIKFPKDMQGSRIYAFEVANIDRDCPKVFYHGNLELEVETGILDAFDFNAIDFCTLENIKFDGNPKLNKVRSITSLGDSFSSLLFLQKNENAVIANIYW